MKLSKQEQSEFAARGYVIRRGFADASSTAAMLEAARVLARRKARGQEIHEVLVQPESALADTGVPLEDRTSKIFRVHRRVPVFQAFSSDPATTDILASLLGPDVDCFLSQFIFKQPGALGQPWHQDAFYFPFDGPHQIGIWLAVTESRLDNGPLWVLPGSHTEPVHRAERDRREHANPGYFEIVDHDMTGEVPVLMAAGDLLVFDAHLMHRSTDNKSDDLRAAMVYHYASADTVDNSVAVYGRRPANQEWVPVLRAGNPA